MAGTRSLVDTFSNGSSKVGCLSQQVRTAQTAQIAANQRSGMQAGIKQSTLTKV